MSQGWTKGELISILDDVHDEALHLSQSCEDRDVETGGRLLNILARYAEPELKKVQPDPRQLELVHVPAAAYDANGTYIEH